MKYSFIFILLFTLGCHSQKKVKTKPQFTLSQDFKNYWFDGTAELSSSIKPVVFKVLGECKLWFSFNFFLGVTSQGKE